ncbi:MAG: NAD(P)H-binding protein [Mangrovibacterium sp.]
MKIIILGATGSTGLDLLNQSLSDDKISEVIVFVRRKLHLKHPKLTCHVVNFDLPEKWNHLIEGDVVFSCLGTTLKDAGSKEAQFEVDYMYQYEFAHSAKINGVKQYVLVSSVGASTKSPFFYTRIKGALEESIQKLNFKELIIFRPPSLIRPESTRNSEIIGVKLLQFLNKIGLFRSASPLPTEELAKAMLIASPSGVKGTRIFQAKDIRSLLQQA